MEAGAAEVGTTGGIFAYGVAEAFELAAADFVEVGAIGAGGGSLIKEDGNAEATPDFKAGLAGEQGALVKLDAGNGYEGDDVRGADAGVSALLAGEVNEVNGFAGAANGRFDDCVGFSCDGDHGTVVGGIHGPVEQAHTVNAHGGHDGLNAARIGAFREVRYAFDEWAVHGLLQPDGRQKTEMQEMSVAGGGRLQGLKPNADFVGFIGTT
jgi:hypothetical protein